MMEHISAPVARVMAALHALSPAASRPVGKTPTPLAIPPTSVAGGEESP
ncbi:hypothetical protein QE401_003948 [Pseudoroseomonas cervicalis]|nr:hypothetical protein [Pseudoroseomonas cervicalis]